MGVVLLKGTGYHVSLSLRPFCAANCKPSAPKYPQTLNKDDDDEGNDDDDDDDDDVLGVFWQGVPPSALRPAIRRRPRRMMTTTLGCLSEAAGYQVLFSSQVVYTQPALKPCAHKYSQTRN